MARTSPSELTSLCYPFEPCIATAAETFLQASEQLGQHRWASFARASCVPYLFNEMESVFASGEEPISGINQRLDRLTAFFQVAAASNLPQTASGTEATPTLTGSLAEREAIETSTGQHYGRLFSAFSATSYWDEPVKLLRTRLERNGIDLSRLPEQAVLDAGCGGGRYTVAWRLLGARHATGIDISELGVADAQRRVQEAGLDGLSFQQASALALPFPDNNFDVVFSNGVLHHTVDWQTGINELLRVLKPGGLGWLYLIENPGGLFWSLIDVMRALMKGEQHEFARLALQVLGVPSNRIYYMLDHVLVPINLRLTPAQIEQALIEAGATQIRRLQRGVDFDRVEQIYQGLPYAEVKYGVGENRYVFSKD